MRPGTGATVGAQGFERGPRERLARALRPGWARGVVLRRAAAALLVVLAAVLAVRGDPAAAREPVLLAARDLAPGQVLGPEDVVVGSREAGAAPSGAFTEAAQVTGRPVAGAVRVGEALTDVRVLGPALLAAATGSPDAVAVPVRLADAGVADLLRTGDRVAVVRGGTDIAAGAAGGAGPEEQAPRVVADDATVLLVGDADRAPGSRDGRLVVLGLSPERASAVASASLGEPLTVTVR